MNTISLSERIPMPSAAVPGKIASWERVPVLTETCEDYVVREQGAVDAFIVRESSIISCAKRDGKRFTDVLVNWAREHLGCTGEVKVEELRFHASKSTAYRVVKG